MGRILGILFARIKHFIRHKEEASEGDLAPVEQRGRWKRAFLLAPLLIGLLVVSVVEAGHPATGKARKAGIIAALMDPLAFIAERSPGERGGGVLLSTKPGLGPSERVLSEVRDRDPPVDNGFAPTPEDIAAIPNGLPGSENALGAGPPGDPGAVSPFFAPFTPGGSDPSNPGLVGSPPPGIPLPGGGAVPEPATWAMMILGFFAVGWAVRRRRLRASSSITAPANCRTC